MKKNYEILSKTIQNIEKYGMIQESLGKSKGPMCLLGHLQKSAGIPKAKWREADYLVSDKLEPIIRALTSEIETMGITSLAYGYSQTGYKVVGWNDLQAPCSLSGNALALLKKVRRQFR